MNADLQRLFSEMKKIREDIDAMKSVDKCKSDDLNKVSSIEERYVNFSSNVLAYIKRISDEVASLSTRMDDMENYSRRNCLLIHGVPEVLHEHCEDTVIKLLALKNVATLDIRQVDRAHRLGTNRNSQRPRPIIIKFIGYGPRSLVFKNKSKLKGTGITITESLTKQRQEVLSSARATHGIGNVWSLDGKIIILNGGKKHKITTLAQLDAIPVPNIEKKLDAANKITTRSRNKEISKQ